MERPARDDRAGGRRVRRRSCWRRSAPAGRPIDLRREPDARLPPDGEPNRLRPDDLLFIAVAAIPGAVAGGRIGYLILHYDYYSANSAALSST